MQRNNLSYVVASGAFEAFQVLLGGFDTKHFGSKADAFAILANLLQHVRIVSSSFCAICIYFDMLMRRCVVLCQLNLRDIFISISFRIINFVRDFALQTLIAENFLCGTPYSLSLLYMDSTAVFPLDMPTTLHLWKSLCSSLTSEDSCETVSLQTAKFLNVVC